MYQLRNIAKIYSYTISLYSTLDIYTLQIISVYIITDNDYYYYS